MQFNFRKILARKKAVPILIATVFFICMAAILSYHEVDHSLTEEDLQYIPKYLNKIKPLSENPTFKEELEFIISAQQSVLNIAYKNDGLPYCQKREPKELYEAKTGLCYDRSRVIEKIFRYSGFETRHVSIYSTDETASAIKSLITPGVSSHAVTEVLTKNGWLVVDSNDPWVSIDINCAPISINDIHLSIENSVSIKWLEAPPTSIYKKPFIIVYGLYSRHGRFYPPYNFIPDIHWGEFVQNLL